MRTHLDLLQELLVATKPSEVSRALQAIGDNPELSVDEPFGDNSYQWHFYGDTESNLSSIHLGSKPGRSLTERITNAIDAILEEKVARGAHTPSSPMEAAKIWFGRPPTTADSGLFAWKDYRTYDYDRLIQVVMSPGDDRSAPTIDIIDRGIGISPNDFASTILSLQRGNKMKKPYLVGAFGQGGAATIRFSKYTLIVSRRFNSPSTVGFTIVRLMRLPVPYKVDAYVYLGTLGEDGKLTVPSCQIDGLLEIYPNIDSHGVAIPEYGTIVRHYGYELRGLENPLQASPGNLYHLFQGMMFDPLIPFTLYDLRKQDKKGKYKKEVILGSRNRLMKYVVKASDKDEELEEEENSEGEEVGVPMRELRHHFPRELVSLRPDSAPSVGIEYWVVLNRRKSGEKVTLRNGSELFVDRVHPIIGTLNGQNHGDRTESIFKELDLSTVAKHIVVHIDATNADRDTRLELFSSTREGFTEGTAFKELMRLLRDMFKDDEILYQIENELVEAIIQRETAGVDKEVKKEIVDLLRDAGLQVKDPGETTTPGKGEDPIPPARKTKRGPTGPLPPLPTLPYPQVTKLDIIFPKDKLAIPLNARYIIMIETDADFRFDREGRLEIRSEPRKLEIAMKSDLRGGRMKWRLRPTEDAKPGDTGEIIVSITLPGGAQLSAKLLYEVLPAEETKGKRAKGLVPPFDVRPVNPYTQPEIFENLWPDIPADSIPSVAYRADKKLGEILVYYSTAFEPYSKQLERLKSQPSMTQLFQHYYKIWIGYHAILQHMQKSFTPEFEPQPDTDQMHILNQYLDQIQEQMQERERALVAEMLVKQAFKSAELRSEMMTESSV